MINNGMIRAGEERWRNIPKFNDYQVSDWGRVRSFKRARTHIMKPFVPLKGRTHVGLHRNGSKSMDLAELVAKAFIKPKLEIDEEVAHIDGDTNNNRLTNLKIVKIEGRIEPTVTEPVRQVSTPVVQPRSSIENSISNIEDIQKLIQNKHGCEVSFTDALFLFKQSLES